MDDMDEDYDGPQDMEETVAQISALYNEVIPPLQNALAVIQGATSNTEKFVHEWGRFGAVEAFDVVSHATKCHECAGVRRQGRARTYGARRRVRGVFGVLGEGHDVGDGTYLF